MRTLPIIGLALLFASALSAETLTVNLLRGGKVVESSKVPLEVDREAVTNNLTTKTYKQTNSVVTKDGKEVIQQIETPYWFGTTYKATPLKNGVVGLTIVRRTLRAEQKTNDGRNEAPVFDTTSQCFAVRTGREQFLGTFDGFDVRARITK